jgi:S-DNA-T family DNA segregation ATPase FtsK/SpoIIIE
MSQTLNRVTKTILKTFADFNVPMKVLKSHEGFSYYHIYLVPTKPVRMHDIRGFVDDLRFALGRYVVKIEAPVMLKKEILIRVIKDDLSERVAWSSLHTDIMSDTSASPLLVPLGVTEERKIRHLDLVTVGNLIVGGRTSTGKSNFLHGLLNTLLLRHGPDTLRLMLVDPTGTSFTRYESLPHLLTKPVKQADKTVLIMRWLLKEVYRRFEILDIAGYNDIATYHASITYKEQRGETMPFLLLMIDEMADVMSEFGDEAENLLSKLAMFGKGAGVHFVLTTSSMEPRILRGMLRAHIGAGLSFSVNTKEESDVLVHIPDAEDLLGRGAAIYTSFEEMYPVQLRTGFIEDIEIRQNILTIKKRLGAVDENNLDLTMLPEFQAAPIAFEEEDDLYEDAKQAVINEGKATTSFLQRKLKIGYSRAARLIDLLEDRGVIGPKNGTSSREIFE